VPVYVVPERGFGVTSGSEVLPLTVKDTFSEIDKQKWLAMRKVAGSNAVMAELCYRSAYNDLKRGVASMKADERSQFLVDVGGHHSMALLAVRVCNMSLRQLELLPLRHRDYTPAERALRTEAYVDDAVFLRTCQGEICKAASASFAKNLIGVPFEAER
jgi:hypothetical protein